MNSKKLTIIYRDNYFDFKSMNSRRGFGEVIIAPESKDEVAKNDFILAIEDLINQEIVDEISFEMTTQTKANEFISMAVVEDRLINALIEIHQIPIVSERVNSGRLKIRAMVFDNETGLYEEVAHSDKSMSQL